MARYPAVAWCEPPEPSCEPSRGCDPFAAGGSVDDPIEVDLWEHNRVIDETGTVTLDQVILWRFRRWGAGSSICPSYYVVAWSLAKEASPPQRINGRWVGQVKGRWYSALLCSETVTAFDPEIEDRKRLREDER